MPFAISNLTERGLIQFPLKTTAEMTGNKLNAVDIELGLHLQSFTHYPVTRNSTCTTSLLVSLPITSRMSQQSSLISQTAILKGVNYLIYLSWGWKDFPLPVFRVCWFALCRGNSSLLLPNSLFYRSPDSAKIHLHNCLVLSNCSGHNLKYRELHLNALFR